MSYIDTSALSESERARLVTLARGCYQRDLARGERSWSGSDLKGSDKRDSSLSYSRSRDGLVKRWAKNGFAVLWEMRDRRRVAVVRAMTDAEQQAYWRYTTPLSAIVPTALALEQDSERPASERLLCLGALLLRAHRSADSAAIEAVRHAILVVSQAMTADW